MNTRLLRIGAGACLLAGLALAPAPALAQGGPASDYQDVAFLGGSRPVLIRVHITVDGKPLAAARERYVKQWLDFLDGDGDGVLSREEARYVPSALTLQQMRATGVFPNVGINQPGRAFASMAELDLDRDGKVTLAELAAYFDRAGFRTVELSATGPQRGALDAPSEALFQHLDARKEGKLSREGVRQAADALLRKFDANDDELVTADELTFGVGGNANGFRPVAVQLATTGRVRGGQSAGSFYAVSAGVRDNRLGQMILTYFDKDRDSRLSRAESGMDAATFERLDTNKDGSLDAEELSAWHQRPPDNELTVRLGQQRGRRPAVEAGPPREGKAAGGMRADAPLRLTFGDAELTVRSGDGQNFPVRVGLGRNLLQQFKLADPQNKGYVNVKGTGVASRTLRGLLTVADRNRDGKVTLEEMTAFVKLMEDAPRGQVTLSITEQGRALFQLLDTNRDGRLSVQELRTAWDRLAPLDKNGDGFIGQDEIAKQFEVTVTQGPARFLPRGVVVVNGRLQQGQPPRRALQRGPVWFRKMDLNGDGFVSAREFLGTAEDFRRIDTDGDGLISAEEAERHDATVRRKQD